MQGKIIIGTEVDTSGIKEGLVDVEEISRQVSEKIGKNLTDSQRKRLEKEVGNINEILASFYSKLEQYDAMIGEISNSPFIFQSDIENAAKLKKEIMDMIPLINKITGDKLTIPGFNDIERKIPKIGSGLKSIVKTVTRWGLAVFSVRSAYSLIRRAISTIMQQDEEMAAKVQYISYIVAYTLKPVIEWLVNAVYKLISIINGILKGLFGISLNTQDAADAFNKANKNAKSLKKTLAGFDEMNVLSDTSGGGGAGAPGLPDDSGAEEKAAAFKEMWNEMLEAERMATAQLFLDSDKTWGLLKFGWFDTIQGLVYAIQGLFDFLKGLFQIIVGLAQGDMDMVKEGLSNLLKGILEGLRGLWQFITGLAEMVIGLVWGIVKTIWDWIYNNLIQPIVDKIKLNWETTKAVFNTIVNVIKGIINTIGNFFKGLWESIKSGFNSAVAFVKNIFNSVVTFFKNIISTIVGLFKTIGTKVGDAVGGAFKAVINGVLSAIENILNFPIKSINKLIKTINEIPGIDLKTLSTFKFPRLARGGIVNNPGPGVMMGNYIAGERGPEAVLPLTDDTLQRLANMIPITVYLTNTMDGRIISREIQKIKKESDFAFNR